MAQNTTRSVTTSLGTGIMVQPSTTGGNGTTQQAQQQNNTTVSAIIGSITIIRNDLMAGNRQEELTQPTGNTNLSTTAANLATQPAQQQSGRTA
jgi:hypothetical protein